MLTSTTDRRAAAPRPASPPASPSRCAPRTVRCARRGARRRARARRPRPPRPPPRSPARRDGARSSSPRTTPSTSRREAMLDKRGYTVEFAANGAEASRRARALVRARAHGLPDAGDGRLRGHRRDPQPRDAATTTADRRHDRPRHEGRPRALPGRRHGRLPLQADPAEELGALFARGSAAARRRRAPRRRGAAAADPFEALVDEARMRVFRVDYPEIVDQLIELFVESTPPLLGRAARGRRGAATARPSAAPRTSSRAPARTSARASWPSSPHDLEVAGAAEPAQLDGARPRVRGHPRRAARRARWRTRA